MHCKFGEQRHKVLCQTAIDALSFIDDNFYGNRMSGKDWTGGVK